MARCPQCKRELPLTAESCTACHAVLNAPGGWRPLPVTPEEEAASALIHTADSPGRSQARDHSLWLYFFVFIGILGIGAMYGVAAHRTFDRVWSVPGQGRSGLMMGSFLVGVPMVIAVLWAVLLARVRQTGFWATILTSVVPVVFFIFVAGVFLREGFVCILMAMPLFIVVGLVGSALGWASEKMAGDHTPKMLGIAVFAPFLLATAEDQATPPTGIHQVTRSIFIQAPPERVWRDINFPTGIRREELQGGWAYRMGVPYPLEARTLEPRVGGLRELRWERGVRFQEMITRYDEPRSIEWRYQFTRDSFPPGSLDDHIVIGGEYFDLLDTGYQLAPEAGGTRLTLRVGYRVSTTFNWYAEPWARFLIHDTAGVILRFYQQRGERT